MSGYPSDDRARRMRDAIGALDSALQNLADLMYAVDDLTRRDGKRAFTKRDNREAALRAYLDAIGNVRCAQQELRELLYPSERRHEG